MLVLKASLESIKTRKNVTDDVIRTVVFHVWSDDPAVMARLDALYRQPLEIAIEVKE